MLCSSSFLSRLSTRAFRHISLLLIAALFWFQEQKTSTSCPFPGFQRWGSR